MGKEKVKDTSIGKITQTKNRERMCSVWVVVDRSLLEQGLMLVTLTKKPGDSV